MSDEVAAWFDEDRAAAEAAERQHGGWFGYDDSEPF
ncbi:MAG: hypothetical protein JWM34_3527 [Ilumatobacteraceae bacterium]|nr:hypothetical protein [Ilumatobacteraceae bacterium]